MPIKFHFYCEPDIFLEDIAYKCIVAVMAEYRPQLIKNLKEAKSGFVMQKREWLVWDMWLQVIMRGSLITSKKGENIFLTDAWECLHLAELINRNYTDIEKLQNKELTMLCSKFSKDLSYFMSMVAKEGE